MLSDMQIAQEMWRAIYWGFWAYPFIAIRYYRRRRFIRELAAIGSGYAVNDITYERAAQMLKRTQDDYKLENKYPRI